MLNQISIILVGFFLVLIGLTVIILLAISPKAAKEVKSMMANSGNSTKSKASGLSMIMQELSTATNMGRIEELLDKIRAELKSAEGLSGVAQQRQTKTIQKWLEEFSPELHIDDIKDSGVSQQVQFDNETKNFRLMIAKK